MLATTTLGRLVERLFSRSRPLSRKPRRRNPLQLESLEQRLAPSATYYVAVSGNNSHNGTTTATAFATIQKAVNVATAPGDVIYVEGGTYHQVVTMTHSGNAAGAITLTNYDGQTVILNGSSLSNSSTALTSCNSAINVHNASYVTITGLEIENVQTNEAAAGIVVQGTSSHVTLSDNVITDVKGEGAYGIWVDGNPTNVAKPAGTLSNLTISGNTIDGLVDTSNSGSYGIYLYDPTSATTANVYNVTVSSNTIYNLTAKTANNNDDLSGVRVEGAANNVDVASNVIYKINGPENLAVTATDSSNAGMGITIYGASPVPISNLTINDNEVYNCQLGISEALTLNGNVTGFKVTNNTVYDVSNIGIDCIGGDSSIDLNGWKAAKGVGIARDGTVSGNKVYDCHSAYSRTSTGYGYAGGIYVDGGDDISVTDNVSYDNDIGLEVGAENPGITASGITVSDNLIYNNVQAGLVFGGYQKSAGRVDDCHFVNNTVYNNDTDDSGGGQLWIQDGSSNVVANNIFYATGSEGLVADTPDVTDLNNQLDYNLYYAPTGATNLFTWKNTPYTTFAAYQAASHQDAQSLFAKNPDFVDAATGNFALDAGSPALGAGTSKSLWYALKNYAGQTRALPPNIGAY